MNSSCLRGTVEYWREVLVYCSEIPKKPHIISDVIWVPHIDSVLQR